MAVARLDAHEVIDASVRALGLTDAGVDLFSPEAFAASIRRAASFLCPTTAGRIVRAVVEVLEGLPGFAGDTKSQVETMLDSLVAYGDLLELATEIELEGRRIFLGSPSFVRRASGSWLLMGIRPEAVPLVGEELYALIAHDGHVRTVRPSEAAGELVASAELTELSRDVWLQPPRVVPPGEFAVGYVNRLRSAGPSGDIDGLRILDTSAPVTYYKGRWRLPKKDDRGQFVGSRPRAFGTELWCFVEVSEGHAVRLVDLPIAPSLAPAADEAWRLQAALDAMAGHPQRVSTHTSAMTDSMVLEVFSPLPSWAQRRLDVVGTPLLRSGGALLSYRLPLDEVDEELQFLRATLWVSTDDGF